MHTWSYRVPNREPQLTNFPNWKTLDKRLKTGSGILTAHWAPPLIPMCLLGVCPAGQFEAGFWVQVFWIWKLGFALTIVYKLPNLFELQVHLRQ